MNFGSLYATLETIVVEICFIFNWLRDEAHEQFTT